MGSDVRVKREYAEEMINTYNRLHRERMKEENKENKVCQMYCAMHQLAIVENSGKFPGLSDKLTLNKGEYEDILSLAEKYNKRYKMFAYKNLAATTSLSLILFIVMYLILKMDVKTCLLTVIVLFMLDLFMNGKTNQSRYQTKWIRDVNKKVDPNIIKMCNKLFKM